MVSETEGKADRRPDDQDWQALARRARRQRHFTLVGLTAFLALVSVPIILPYLWMVMIAFTARTGGAETATLWQAVAILLPMIGVYCLAHGTLKGRQRVVAAARVRLSSHERRSACALSRSRGSIACKL